MLVYFNLIDFSLKNKKRKRENSFNLIFFGFLAYYLRLQTNLFIFGFCVLNMGLKKTIYLTNRAYLAHIKCGLHKLGLNGSNRSIYLPLIMIHIF